MSYLAIARKYRPATFADIVGQDHVVRTLSNAIESGRIHHAYLFCGARGVGKTTAARALAKGLNCVNGPTATPCGVCVSCVEIAAGSSPDLIEIDGASNNSVEDVRELRDTVGYAPTRGKYKIYLVDEVHMLSKAAFNALLKTLEEPPPHVVFLFATTEPNRILDTILSRVQRFDFKRIGIEPVAERLAAIAQAERVTLSDAALRLVARAGEGSMRDAQSLLDKVLSFAGASGAVTDAAVAEALGLVDRTLLHAFVRGLLTGDPEASLDAVARVYEQGYELSELTSDALELLRDGAFVSLSEGARRHVDRSADELGRLEDLVRDVPLEVITRTFHALLDVHDQVSRAARPRIVLEMAVARLATRRPVEPVSGLLARLEELERRTRTGGPVPRSAPGPRAPSPPPSPRASSRPAPAKKTAPAPAPSPEPAPQTTPAPATPPTTFESRWADTAAALRAAGAEWLADAVPELRGNLLALALEPGRALAEGRRAWERPEIHALVQSRFAELELRPPVPLGGVEVADAARQARAQTAFDADPDAKRIIQKLGAEVADIRPPRDLSHDEP
jgi:DNA polymerase-3 subunit gamma/tau